MSFMKFMDTGGGEMDVKLLLIHQTPEAQHRFLGYFRRDGCEQERWIRSHVQNEAVNNMSLLFWSKSIQTEPASLQMFGGDITFVVCIMAERKRESQTAGRDL